VAATTQSEEVRVLALEFTEEEAEHVELLQKLIASCSA
jgi:rubrerythrin